MRLIINTPRLVLRPLALSDAESLSKLAGDYDIARMTGSFPHPFPLLSAEVKIMVLQAMRRRGLAYPYAISIDGGSLIGMVDIFRRSNGFPFELGYWLGKPSWGQGYAMEASTALMKEARDSLDMSELVASCFMDNPGSVRVLEKLGFQKTHEGDRYFSMARLSKAPTIDFHIKLNNSFGQASCATS